MGKIAIDDMFTGKITVVKNLPDHSKDPVFRKKHEAAKELLKKHPIPEKTTKKSK